MRTGASRAVVYLRDVLPGGPDHEDEEDGERDVAQGVAQRLHLLTRPPRAPHA